MSGYTRFALVLAYLILPGCDAERITSGAGTPMSSVEPCAVALTPHRGEERIDEQIVRSQQDARLRAEPVPYLERLGWAFVAKARLSFDPGFYTLAEQSALCIESKKAGSDEALLLRGHVLHHRHLFSEAEAVARRLVAQRGISFDYGLLGDVLMDQGRLDDAIDAYQEMVDQRPSPQAYSRAAHVRWLKGDLPGAMALMKMAATSGTGGNSESAAWVRLRLASYELQAGREQEAAEQIARALVLQPDYAPALLAHGRMLLAQGKAPEAVRPLRRAAEANPLPEYLWALVEALRSAERCEEARVVESRLLDRAAEDPRTLSLYLATIGRDPETALRLALEELSVREDVFTLDAVAWALRAAGRLAEARSFSERALAEGTEDARLFFHAGVIAAGVGLNEEARSWFEKALSMDQMLLPTEREQLAESSAALSSQATDL